MSFGSELKPLRLGAGESRGGLRMRRYISSRRQVNLPVPLGRDFALEEYLRPRLAVQRGALLIHNNPRALAKANYCQVVLLVVLGDPFVPRLRSEEHTSELQSLRHLV